MSLICKFCDLIVNPIFCKWLILGDLCALDSAMCNQTERNLFLCHLRSHDANFSVTGLINQSPLIWISKRNLCLSVLLVCPQDFGDIDTYCNNALSHVKSMTIRGDLENSKDCVLDLVENCSRLEHFSVLDRSGLTNDIVISLANNCHFLRVLDLSGGTSYQFLLSDAALICLSCKCVQLRVLRLSSFTSITDNSIEYVVRHCSDLTELSLTHMFSISDPSLIHIGHHCKTLKLLTILNDKASRHLPVQSVRLPLLALCTTLQSLTLGGYVITDAFAKTLLARCTQLSRLDLSQCVFHGLHPVFEANLRGFTELMKGDGKHHKEPVMVVDLTNDV